MERTLAIIKPDAVTARRVGLLISRIEEEGFQILALKKLQLDRGQAERFYAVHRGKPFYASLTAFMSSGPAVVMVLAAEGAIARWREVMGATDPAKASEGTLRRLYGTSIERNAVHGSDGPETAREEVAFFFTGLELELD